MTYLSELLHFGAQSITDIIASAGYPGIFLLMALEGSFVPIPSEVILPFSGYLVSQGVFSIWMVALVGALANITGTLFTYTLARYVGLPFFLKYGKYVLVSKRDIERAHRLFERYGIPIIFISRLLPGVRGFVPIPAGVARMPLMPFVAYVFFGSLIWSFVLTYVGVVLGENWERIEVYTRPFHGLFVILVVLGAIWWVYRFIRESRHDGR